MSFIITSQAGAVKLLREQHNISRIVSISDPNNAYMDKMLPKYHQPRLILKFYDEEDPPKNRQPPAISHIQQLIRFLRNPTKGITLIHCWAGCRRSGAAGYIYACMTMGRNKEKVAAYLASNCLSYPQDNKNRIIPEESQPINPNRRMVRLADEILQRDGKMLEVALEVWKRPDGRWKPETA